MDTMKLLIGTAVISLTVAFTNAEINNWKVKDDYSVKCSLTPTCYFKGLKANILFDEENPGKSSITASIDARTINTGNDLMNKHAKEELAVDKFPEIMFVSTAISKISS